MNTFQLTCFLAVAETLSFGHAAELLNVTQPAVTHQIHTLEAELHVKLFRRTTRTVALTQEGRVFIGDAQNILHLLERAQNRFAQPAEQEVQTLSVGCHIHGQLFMLAEVLHQMRERYPHLHPRLQVVPFQYLYRMLAENEMDAVMAFQQVSGKKLPLLYKELGKIPVVGYCAAGHPLAGKARLTVDELSHEKLILHDPRRSPDPITRLQAQLTESHIPAELHFCDSEEAAITLAQAGYGVAVLPGMLVDRTPPLAGIPIEGVEPLSFGLYYKTLAGNPLLRDFITLAREHLAFGKEAAAP